MARMIKLATGTLVDARYEIIEEIGQGGIGTVFKARELGTERIVALKMLHLTLVADHDSRERFRREGLLLSRLEHPNILRCYRFGVWNDRWPYISMEYLNGLDLQEVSGMNESRALTIVRQACLAMDYAHQQSIIHRDLRPANMIILDQPEVDFVKVVDFGLARALPKDGQTSQHLTQTGTLIGSIYYMSPEQCTGKKADARSDIYSLGCILYELLAGAPPLTADTPVGLMHLHATASPAPLTGVAPGLNATVMRAMAKNPEHRFQSMLEFHAALDMVSQGRGAEVPEFAEPKESMSKTRALLVAVVLTMVTLMIIIGGVVLLLPFPRTNRELEFGVSSATSKLMNQRYLRRLYRDVSALDCAQLPPERTIQAWLQAYGAEDAEGASLARYYLFLEHPADKDKTRYALPARDALVKLLQSKSRRTQALNRLYLLHEIMMITLLSDYNFTRSSILSLRCSMFFEYHQYLSPSEERTLARELARLLNKHGDYTAEERVRQTVSNPDAYDMILLERCKFRQQSFSPKSFNITGPPALPHNLEEVAGALIEMNLLDQALTLLGSNSFESRDIMYAFCLTRQKKFQLCRDFLKRQWLDIDSNVDSKNSQSEQRAYVVAALLYNAAAEGKVNKTEPEAFIKEIRADTLALTIAAYLCSRDDRSSSATLSQLAAKCIECMDEGEERSNLAALLARTTNDIDKPRLLHNLLLKVRAHAKSLPVGLFIEVARAERLDGRPLNLNSFKVDVANLRGSLTDNLYLRFMLEKAKTSLAQGKRDAAKQHSDYCLANLANCSLLAVDRSQILEEIASVESQLGNKIRAGNLVAESARVLPPRCRTHWDNWAMLHAATADEGSFRELYGIERWER